MMSSTRLILVGGFLGAGKTTLLGQAARRLAAQGRRVGLVTNDQAANLVDTAILEGRGSRVREVAGGCFCCRFPDLLSAMDQLLVESSPDAIVCEPVGSCTDISATVLQPIKQLYGDRFRVAPYGVVIDPLRATENLSQAPLSGFSENVLYIFRKQLEEADLIVVNKIDLLAEREVRQIRSMLAVQFPDTPVYAISARTGEGVDEWLEAVGRDAPAGRRIAEVDYDRYAEGEAVLGWLNATVALEAVEGADWQSFCLDFLERIRTECRARAAEIAHVKMLLASASGSLQANLTSTAGLPVLESTGRMDDDAGGCSLVINARVHLSPDTLRKIVQESLRAAAHDGIQAAVLSLESFQPGRPVPTHRFAVVV